MEKSTKKYIFLIMIIFQFLSLTLFGSTIEYEYYFKKPQITKQGDYHRIEMDGLMSISKPGEPELPGKSVQLLLPPGEQAVSISVFYKGINDLPGEYRVYPRQRPYPIGYQGKVEFTEPNPEIYNSDKPFPEKLHTEIQTQYLRGYSIAILNIFPVQYIPASGEISYFSEMKVVIETEPIVEAENSFNNFYRNDKITNGRVKNIVHNPEQIELYPSHTNTRSGDNKYVIITGNSYSSDFASFADFKTKQGYNVLIKTVEEIYSDPTFLGVDNADEIRNFIKYAYQNLGTEYILLGGDVEIVPHRGFWINTGSGTEDYDIPADLYYAALDRVGSGPGPDWNTNNDSKWGETSEADYYAEVYIGRISADIGSEFSAALNKQMMYQQSPVAADLEKAILVGEELNDAPQTWGGTYKDEIMNGGTYNGYTTTGFPGNFTVQTQYERNGSWSWTDLKNKMNAGTNIINHLGHSNPNYNMQFYRSYVTNTNLTSNGTNHNFYIIYTQGCTAGGFDNRWTNGWYDPEDCIGEKFTTISNGCVAFIGNSRYGWYIPAGTNSSSQYLDRQFFDALFGENIYKLGEMNEDSKEDGVSQCNSNPWFRWSYYCVNLFGDPSLDIWTDAPATLSPTYAGSIYTTNTQLIVSVGISGALVGLSQNGNHIGSGITDGTGSVNVIFDNSPSVGTMDIYITAHNYNIHTGTITVYGSSLHTLQFDGIDEYVNCGHDASLNLTTTMTIEAWINPTGWGELADYGFGRIVDKSKFKLFLNDDAGSYNAHSLVFIIHSGGSSFALNTPENSVSLGSWQHIAATYDGNGDIHVYINGIEQTLTGLTPLGNIDDNSLEDLFIGESFNQNRAFEGAIDELRIWNVVLNSSVIRENMYRTLQGNETGLISYWQFNEDSGSTAFDFTGGNNGILHNMTDSNWITSTAPIPYYTISGGNWESNSVWASGQNAPEHAWSRVRIEHNITINSTFEVIELKIDFSSTLTITTGYQLTVSGGE